MGTPHRRPVYIGDALECALLKGILNHIPDLGSDSRRHSGGWNLRVNEKTAEWVSGTVRGDDVGADNADDDVGADNESGATMTVLEGRDMTLQTIVTHEFDAAVQRMTVIALVTHAHTNTTTNENNSTHNDTSDQKPMTEFRTSNKHDYLVAMKGSPESVFLCLKQQKDEEFKQKYFSEYEKLAKMGKRVISFASKRILDLDSMGSGRECAEKDMVFEGFVAFSCPLRYVFC